ncbi:MAG TPA: GNAT family N-acetyltransferase [Streptosporangiaceae bacterium]|nr:GNAT family N-acetyltransferase [Streptosporangiaceae bacterium]
MLIRDATAAEMTEVAQVRVTAYQAGSHLEQQYEQRLRELGADGIGDVLVAVTARGEITGTVMLQPWPHAGRVVTGPDEAEIRALAVLPRTQGEGLGKALLEAVIERARVRQVRHLVLFTQHDMVSAQHLYAKAGFARLADRDWSPEPGNLLLAYGLLLAPFPAE